MNDSKAAVGEIQAAGSHALVVTTDDERQAIALMDRNDLDQALAELRGDVIEQFVYVVPERRTKKGQVIPAKQVLTYAGIKEAARLFKNVHFGAGAQLLSDGTWMLTAWAHNLADNTRIEYPMPYPAFDPRDTYESTDFRANLSKSIRNALAAVLPVAYLNTMIKKWLEQKEAGPAGAIDVTDLQREIAVLLGYDDEARNNLQGQNWTAHPLPKLVEMKRRLVDRAEKRLAVAAPVAAGPTPEELAPDLVTVTEDGEVVLDGVIEVTPEPVQPTAPPTRPVAVEPAEPVEDEATTKSRLAVVVQDLCDKVGRPVPASTRDWVTLGTALGLPAITKSSQMSVVWLEQVRTRLEQQRLAASDAPIGHTTAFVKYRAAIDGAADWPTANAALDEATFDTALADGEYTELDALARARFEQTVEAETVGAAS